ncbi:hypothetical protein IMZ48_09600 [Candidatus Bathyarchaeota archaeon]|nr:hypothetical protein [Candidatus Bathyarchaeota archaeon]
MFSIIRRGRQQAKEHSQNKAERKRKEDAQPTYRHVPTHAAADALVGAPPTSRAEDKPRIMEENRRRGGMANGGAASGTQGGIPRASSSLSNVMYPSAHANPMVATARSHGYQSPQQWQHQYHRAGTEVVYSIPDPPFIPEVPRPPSLKGKEAERWFALVSSRAPSLLGDQGEL